MSQHNEPIKEQFLLSTNYNSLPSFNDTLPPLTLNKEYTEVVNNKKDTILLCVDKAFQEVYSYIIHTEVEGENPFLTGSQGKPDRMTNLGLILENLQGFFELAAKKGRTSPLSIQQLNSLVDSVMDETRAPIEELSPASGAVKNIQRTQIIVKNVMEKLLECFGHRDLAATSFPKYAGILKCLIGEIRFMLQSHDLLERATEYDPYAIPAQKPDPLAETIRGTQTLNGPTGRSGYEDEPHFYPRERLHFNKPLEPQVLDYIEPAHHRVYICEAAKAYADVAPSRITRINADRHPRYSDYASLF